RGAAELRVKESDRIAVMAKGLRALGIRIEETPDGAIIEGGKFSGGEVDSAGDHRCAMSFAVAGLIATAPVHVRNCANVATSFPGFLELARDCRFSLKVA
ncbi:MAG: 3-phosphoshikimate 1-carboxyvinyltransferase, partial [Proteobacteria bacterium]|nr:3-phosphoshikimate 1-carboxyvinyltransferase [Pseudomonadota bacterium]